MNCGEIGRRSARAKTISTDLKYELVLPETLNSDIVSKVFYGACRYTAPQQLDLLCILFKSLQKHNAIKLNNVLLLFFVSFV